MRDLFHRRADEGSETFPFWLPNDSQPAAKLPRGGHNRIVWKRRADFSQWMIEREIMPQQFLIAIRHYQIATLLNVTRPIADCADKSVARFFPMKDLTRSQRHRQVELWRHDFAQSHAGNLALRKI